MAIGIYYSNQWQVYEERVPMGTRRFPECSMSRVGLRRCNGADGLGL